MTKNTSLTKHIVTALVADAPKLSALFDVVEGYTNKIAERALAELQNRPVAYRTWQMFIDGMNKWTNTIPMGTKRLSDFPQVGELVLSEGFSGFFEWVQKNNGSKALLKQAVLRNLFHFFEHTLRTNGKQLSDADLEQMREEFRDLDYRGQTRWLSNMFNGLQTSIVEVYVSSEIMKKL